MTKPSETPRKKSGRLGSDPFEGLGAQAWEASQPAAPGAEPAGADAAAGCTAAPAAAASGGPSLTAEPMSLVACPYLGLADDPETHFSVPDQDHICRGTRRQSDVPELQQRAYCLNAQYSTCVVFAAMQQGKPAAPPWGREAGGARELLDRVLRRR